MTVESTALVPENTEPSLVVGDVLCGALCIVILVLGLLGNIPAIVYFTLDLTNKVYLSQKKLLFDGLFVCITITDTLICLCMLPLIPSFLESRSEILFASSFFCKLWGVTWTVLPYMSVFLVATLSFTRTYTLVRPLGSVSCNYVLSTVGIYLAYLVLRSAVPLLATSYTTSKYIYFNDSAMCMEDIKDANAYWQFKMIANQVQLLLPIFPVTISCVVSFVVLHRKRRKLQCSNRVAKMQSEATMTIMMVTALYWICNVPVVVNYMYFHMGSQRGQEYADLYGTVFMHWYSWPLTLGVSVGFNSLLNPLVYLCRMKRFREFLMQRCQRFSDSFSVTVRPSTTRIDLPPTGNCLKLRKLSPSARGSRNFLKKYEPNADKEV